MSRSTIQRCQKTLRSSGQLEYLPVDFRRTLSLPWDVSFFRIVLVFSLLVTGLLVLINWHWELLGMVALFALWHAGRALLRWDMGIRVEDVF